MRHGEVSYPLFMRAVRADKASGVSNQKKQRAGCCRSFARAVLPAAFTLRKHFQHESV